MAVLSPNISAHLQNQLTRSLERILEEANQSGELKLSNRKLKDFPKAGSKYNLRDTVTADISKNKFGELPEEIGNFCFLEKLYCYHNVIRYLPDTIGSLGCLSYLDLSRNQLTCLPKEICQLPIQILLISNNRLTSLPDDLYRMTKLTELDASSNQLTHLPPRMGDLWQLQSLNLRSNHLLCIPTEVTFLQLVKLDLRANRIGVLPVEMREMQNLMELYVDDNPLTSPPACLCKRGRVHIFKYLENEAAKLNQKIGTISSGTLGRRPARRSVSSGSTIPVIPSIIPERLKHNKRQNVDSGYSTSSDDKRWSQEISGDDIPWSPIPSNGNQNDNTPSRFYAEEDFEEDWQSKNGAYQEICDRNLENKDNCSSNITYGSEEKSKPLQQVQTYREYKEALKQQRAQDIGSIYRTKDIEEDSYKTEPNTPTHQIKTTLASSKSDPTPLNSLLCSPKHVFDDTLLKHSIQKNNTNLNIKNGAINGVQCAKNYVPDYVKPTSPIKYSTGVICDDIHSINGTNKPASPNSNGTIKLNGINKNGNKSSTWNKEMTFTMRREIDKAREESDLINQLRNIIETRLKMTLPEDLGPALTDGVVLCHLANHIKPRSVASIHVPSPAVPKLTMARCRRNVDNFLEACRKIGVDEENLCSSVDITEALEGRGLPRLLDTINALCHLELESTEQSSVQTIDDTTVSLLLLAVLCITIVFLITNPEVD